MPYRAAHPCAKPGCPEVTNARFCPKHAAEAVAKKAEDDRKYNRFRGSASARGFNYWWRMRSKAYLAEHPICADPEGEHAASGRVTLATEVHHIVDKANGGTDDDDNLQALCKPCHSRITAREHGWAGKHE